MKSLQNELLCSQECKFNVCREWARKKPDAVVGLLGHSKGGRRIQLQALLSFVYLLQAVINQMSEFRIRTFFIVPVSAVFLLGQSSLAPLSRMTVHPTW